MTLNFNCSLPRENPKPIKNHKINLVFETATKSKFTLPILVSIRYADINVTKAEVSEDGKNLNIEVKNIGNETLVKSDVNLSSPFQADIQTLTNLEPNATRTLSFVIGDNNITKPLALNIYIPNEESKNAVPLYEWHLGEGVTIDLNRMPWYIFALWVVVGILTLLVLILYFKRYRHPLVLELSTTPSNLLALPYNQIAEAQKRLSKVNRLENTLAKAGVSQKILQSAIDFESNNEKDKIDMIAKRVGAVVDEKENYFELNLPQNFPLSIESLTVKFLNSENVIDVKDEIQNSGILEGKIILLLAEVDMMQSLYTELTSNKTNMWVTLLPNDLTRVLLSSNPKEVLAKVVSSQIALTQISPYQIGGGVNREAIFFGREKIISHILNKGVSNYIIIGGRQVGKSSLLKAIERRYKEIDGVECYYVSASNENLIEDIKLELDQEQLSDKAFAKFINTSSKRYLFLIDEADDFVKYEKEHNYSGLKFMRSLSEKNNASFILAGFWETYRYTFFDYQSPIKNFASIFELEELEYEACIGLATKPMKSLGLGYESQESVEWMIARLGQRANLIQIVCDYLVENIGTSKKIITKEDIAKALKNEKLLKFFNDWNEMSTDSKEQWIDRVVLYGTIAKGRFDDGDLQELIKRYGLEINSNELDKSLVRLRLGYIIRKEDDGGYVYRVPLFVDSLLSYDVEGRFGREVKATPSK
ncbi:hypothetical protein MNB_SV-12-107 [hydrothermal vent metagenome]|uniref:Uncharacterized protein n=1 Tax=hydrothermal vent metagenome TaxID=652676 RepID=A0A1W1CG17_9ZZZZ